MKIQIPIVLTCLAALLGSGAIAQTNDVSQMSVTNAVDNTGRNVRDRNNQTVTPFDQGNNKADIDTTKQIRQQIIAAKDLSTSAHNVKVITNNGHVTLRGPVNTAEEKQRIGEIANQVAQSENVDNQLEVKVVTGNN